MTKFISLFLKTLVTVPVIALLVFITLGNREKIISFQWSPVHNELSLSVPVIIFIAVTFGFLWGSLILWSNTLQMRVERRGLKKQVQQLEEQIETIQKERGKEKAPAVELLPR